MNPKEVEISFVDDIYDEELGQSKDMHEIMHEQDPNLEVHAENPFASLQTTKQQASCMSRMLNCLFGGNMESPDFDRPPDEDFYADNLIELSHGFTAYRLLEPAQPASNQGGHTPLIILLHGMQNSSYMWADIAELLADFEQGPHAQVLIFDFYGHGRSPWTGVPLSLDVLVHQIRELMDALGLEKPAALVGYDLGGAVATGFAARFPQLCSSLTLISPVGIKYKPGLNESRFATKYLGEISFAKQKKILPELQLRDFYKSDNETSHFYLVQRQISMSHWQIKNTPGYLGALLSTFRNFPLRSMEELFAAVGRHNRRVLIIWGEKDEICPYNKCIGIMDESFPDATVVDIPDCGHNCALEKFEEVVTELLNFHRDVFVKRR